MKKKFWLYLLLIFQWIILILLLTYGCLFFLFLFLFDSPAINKILLITFLIYVPIYLGMIIFTIGSTIGVNKLIKSQKFSLFHKISFIGFPLTVIVIILLLLLANALM